MGTFLRTQRTWWEQIGSVIVSALVDCFADDGFYVDFAWWDGADVVLGLCADFPATR